MAIADPFYLLGAALLLGIRHGVEWDHLAAILDITGGSLSPTTSLAAAGPPPVNSSYSFFAGSAASVGLDSEVARTFSLASLYALGHGFVVIAMGLAIQTFACSLPAWMDPMMEKVVGWTLIILSIWLLYSLYLAAFRSQEFRLSSRWMLLYSGITRIYNWICAKATGRQPTPRKSDLTVCGPRTAFGIGMIHGIGVETSTQIILMTTVGMITNALLSSAMLVAFVAGLVVSNSVVACLLALGFIRASSIKPLYLTLGLIAASFSLIVGVCFVLGKSDSLPKFNFLPSPAAIGHGISGFTETSEASR